MQEPSPPLARPPAAGDVPAAALTGTGARRRPRLDRREIAAIFAGGALGTLQRPLLTLERFRICKRDGRLLATPPALPGADEHGMALWHKLMVYTSEGALHHGEPIHRAIVRRLRSAGLSGATTERGIWGFHGDHAPHGDRLLQLGRHVPAVTIVIDTPERISAAFSVIDELTSERGLVTSETIPAMRASAGDRQRGGTRLATRHLPDPPA